MAEILLSLTIIGVVAAITLPSLTGNINERTWNTQRKALYARMTQALSLMASLNGYGKFSAETETESAVDTVAESFLTEGLSKVLKINNICDNEHLQDCGIPEKITNIQGTSSISISNMMTFSDYFEGFQNSLNFDIKSAAFETQNGESILVYYNPKCTTDTKSYVNGSTSQHYRENYLCVNFVYDLNGQKGPNTMGKDIGFITAFNPVDPMVVAPMPASKAAGGFGKPFEEAGQYCRNQDEQNRLPSLEELTSMVYNWKLLGITDSVYWAQNNGGDCPAGKSWTILFPGGMTRCLSSGVAYCIRR